MGTITLPNLRTTADVTMNTRLKDGGVSVDWAGLTDIKAWLYSDAQRAIAGRCDVSISEADSTKLVCEYSASKPQYPGVNRLIVQARYNGRTKTYDKPVFNFVPRTADQAGTQITMDDPEVDVEIVVEDVSSSILDNIIAAALDAAARAEAAAQEAEHMVDIKTGPAGKSPYKGENGNWFEWDEEAGQYVDTGVRAKGDTGDTPDISIGTVTTVEPGEPAAASMSGTPEAPVLNITIPQGAQGNTGSSVAYPFELVNNLTTDDATKALSAAQGKVLDGKVSQLQQKVDELKGKFYGFYTSSENLPEGDEDGFAYVGEDSPFAVYNFQNGEWADSGSVVTIDAGGNAQPVEIDVTAPPSGYTGEKVSADSANNTPALYALMAWAVANYKNPVLRFPKGTYEFNTAQMFTLVPANVVANSLRITGEDAIIKYTGGALNSLGGWFHIFYLNTQETRHNFSVEVDHLSFVNPNPYADDIHSKYAWIFVQGSQLADVYLDRVSVHDNTFEGQRGAAIQIGYARQCFIERNKLYNCYEATLNDDSGFVIHNNVCYNSIIRDNYLYVDDTKPLCGAGIVVEYQTGDAIIEGNYVYGYDRGIHVEITGRRALQRVVGNHVENCFTGIISWNALSDLEIRGNSVLTGENWNYQDRLTYSEKNQCGIWFPTYARNKSVRIIQNTIQLYAGGNPIANTARGTYSGVAVCPHNWEIAYNEFYTDGAKTPYAKRAFWMPIYSKIHHNIWYGWTINQYGANNTEVYENDFFLENFTSTMTLDAQSYFTPGGESTGMTVLQYATEKVPGLRGLDLQELFGCRYHHNRFQGLNTKGIAWKSIQGILYNNEISIRSANIDGTGTPSIINSITLYPNSHSSGVAIDNTVYEYDGVACGVVNYQGVERNVYYSVDGQGNKTLRIDTNKVLYNTNTYKLVETTEPERKRAHNVTCLAPSVTSPSTNWNKGDYIPGDITINSKWLPGSTLPHHWLCISAGKGVAGSGETQAVWQPIYDNTTIQKTGGTTAQRPTLASGDVGFTYYDSTLGKTIVWNGTAWVNLDGTSLA